MLSRGKPDAAAAVLLLLLASTLPFSGSGAGSEGDGAGGEGDGAGGEGDAAGGEGDGAGGEGDGAGGEGDGASWRMAEPGAVLNELLAAPRELFSEEWVELFNGGPAAAELGGWGLDDREGGGSRPYVIPDGTVLAPGAFLVLNGSVTGLALNNDGDTVRLLDAQGQTVDELAYNGTTYDISLGRVPDGGASWQRLLRATPGAPNYYHHAADSAGRRLLLTQVYVHAYPGMGDEFAAVTNPGSAEVDLSGWRLTDGPSSMDFPEGTLLGAGQSLFATGNAARFRSDAGFLPDLETCDSAAGVPRAESKGAWPGLNDEGGHLALEDPAGEVIDLFAWGADWNGSGWTGPPAGPLAAGRVARRVQLVPGGWSDTNTSADWPSSAATVVGRTWFPFTTFDADWVKTFVSPDCSFDAVADELDSARSSLSLAAYQFESLPLAEKLANASRRGVKVGVLLEGFPVGGITDQQRACTGLMAESGARVRYLSPNASGSNDRYLYVHSKYCVVDELDSIIISENWKTSGLPPDPSYGNRGWGAVVRSRGLAAYLQEVFDRDSDELMRDIYPYSSSSELFGPPPPFFLPDDSVPAGAFSPRARPALFQGNLRVSPVLSPDTSSLPSASVLGLLGSARSTLFIEQLSVDMDWDGGGEAMPDLFLEAAVDAARRGVEVKVLLDGTYLDPSESGEDNMAVLNYLKYTAAMEGLPLEARIASIPGTLKLHNKGVLVDGRSVLVSSLNWVRSSVFENREVGVIIEGTGPAAYYADAFMRDWNDSAANGTRSEAQAEGPWSVLQIGQFVLCVPPVAVAATVLSFYFWKARQKGLRRPSPASAGRAGQGKGPAP